MKSLLLTLSVIGVMIFRFKAHGSNFNVQSCESPWIIQNVDGLKWDLKKSLFGQHIAENIVLSAIGATALVLSFHGWSGSGKNYLVSFIIKNYFRKGLNSNFYHFFSASLHFPTNNNVALYQEQLKNWVVNHYLLAKIQFSFLMILKKMHSGVLDGIKSFLYPSKNVNGVDYRRAIFIFLSNIGSNNITEKYLELQKRGKTREKMTEADFDKKIKNEALNHKGGLYKSDLITHNLIDHYVPFLPLERIHVKQCIEAELDSHNYHYEDRDNIIEEAMKFVTFGPYPEAQFSMSGCKRLGQKIAVLLQQRKMEHDEI